VDFARFSIKLYYIRKVLNKAYTREEYVEQFTLRIPEHLQKLDRIEHTYRTKVPDAPQRLFEILEEQRRRLEQMRQHQGEYISPFALSEVGRREIG
jgi:phosphoenolpyruvate carboxykinase (GTP)